MAKDWQLSWDPEDTAADKHVMPNEDLRDHVRARECWCRPVLDDGLPIIVVHHALDGREFSEPDHRPELSPIDG